ncbi:hypothetical protein [Vibrio fluvialis]|uniref:hypothetical protein n=1 Tax=Vibrio fluvialis TaxID=676 RepID=UPI001F2F1538|nr:hypothetical protein [Vibrio fluvialis]MCE7659727.1 hypothetical protein [Vibrio fluvialis]
MIGFSRYKKQKKGQKFTHPIVIAITTALLACVGSVGGVYLSAPMVISQFIEQKSYENKVKAYENFLRSMSKDTSSVSIKLIGLNQMVRNVTTDASIQKIEDNIEILSYKNRSDKLFLDLISNMQALQLYGSEKVDLYINDFISVLLGNDFLVDWDLHDEDTKSIWNTWTNNNRPAYGFEKKVSDDERAKFIILSAQYVELVKLLKTELRPQDS